MRLFVIAVTIVCVAMPAFAQDMGHSGRHKRTEQKAQTPGTKPNDRDYKSALDRMPTPTEKYDPWGTMRPANDKH